MTNWVKCSERMPTDEPEKENDGDHIHCWCAINGKVVEHLAWNPYHRCWDDQDEDDVSRHDTRVTHWQPLNMPAPPTDFS